MISPALQACRVQGRTETEQYVCVNLVRFFLDAFHEALELCIRNVVSELDDVLAGSNCGSVSRHQEGGWFRPLGKVRTHRRSRQRRHGEKSAQTHVAGGGNTW